MSHSVTVTRFKQLTFFNAGWAVLLGVITVAIHAIVNCADCQVGPLSWHSQPYWSLTTVGFLLAAGVAGWAWYSYRQHRLLIVAASCMVLILGTHLTLSVLTISHSIPATMTHILLVTFYLAFTLFITVTAYAPKTQTIGPHLTNQVDKFYFGSVLLTGGALLVLLISGVAVRAAGATNACQDWPLCQGTLLPSVDFEILLLLTHRLTSVVVGVMIAGLVLQTRRNYPQNRSLVNWSTILAWLYIAQILIGAFYALVDLPTVTSVLHLSLTIVMWGGAVVLATMFYYAPKPAAIEMVAPPPMTGRQKAWLYFSLTKPWILLLLLITTMTGMVIAAKGIPSLGLMVATFLGGVFSAGGASVLNSYIDSDIDQQMSRTSRRATATGLISPPETLIYGLTLSILSVLIFMIWVNPLSAALSTLGLVYYVFFYTMYLKRNTVHNIIIGGAAGSIPPLVGWAAVTGSLNLEALYLFAIIFFWTPPHTWAMALLVEKDYARANVPMLPVVVGSKETVYQTFLYSILMVAVTLLPFSFHMVGWLYLTAAIILGGQFLRLAGQLWQNYNKATSKRLYKYSQSYLALLFMAMAIDRMIFG